MGKVIVDMKLTNIVDAENATETRCLVNPTESTVLIGQIPLEEMDWPVDPQAQRLVSGHEGYPEGLIEMY